MPETTTLRTGTVHNALWDLAADRFPVTAKALASHLEAVVDDVEFALGQLRLRGQVRKELLGGGVVVWAPIKRTAG